MKNVKVLAAVAALPLLLMGCGLGSLAGTSATPVAVLFTGPAGASAAQVDEATLTVEGANGTLDIRTIAAVVSEVEFDCEEDAVAACVEYETGPTFVRLPLDTTVVEVATGSVPVGTYTELDFEIDDLDPDVDDTPAEAAAKAALLSEIRATYPNFPTKASMILIGTFTPTGAASGTDFEAYLEIEIEIEMPLSPSLDVTDGVDPLAIPVVVDPTLWLKQGGDVLELSDGVFREIEVEIENGFVTIEHDEIDGYDDDRDD